MLAQRKDSGWAAVRKEKEKTEMQLRTRERAAAAHACGLRSIRGFKEGALAFWAIPHKARARLYSLRSAGQDVPAHPGHDPYREGQKKEGPLRSHLVKPTLRAKIAGEF
jgi:hypothetical protein